MSKGYFESERMLVLPGGRHVVSTEIANYIKHLWKKANKPRKKPTPTKKGR